MGTMWRRGSMMVGLAALIPLWGCYEHTFTMGTGAPRAPVIYDHWENFWLAGLVGHTRMDVQRMCPTGNATIEAEQTFLNGLVSALTSGIYTPTTLRVRCARGRVTDDVVLDAADVGMIVESSAFRERIAEELPDRLEEVTSAQTAPAGGPTP